MKIQINPNDADQVLALLAEAGIELKTNEPKITKGQMIFDLIEESVSSQEFKTRKDIATEVGCTVSRVSEILKEFADTEVVKAYHILDAETKNLRLQQKEMKKLLKEQEELQEKLNKLTKVA